MPLKKLIWISIPIALIAIVLFSYSYYFSPSPVPEVQESDPNSLFAGDSSSLDWLNDPEIKAEPVEELAEESTEQASPTPEAESAVPTEQPAHSDPSEPKPTDASPTPPSSSPVATQTDILEKYKGKFKALERSYQGKLKGLIEQAKQEYIAVKNGQSNESKISLASKYLSKAKQLESTADSQFYQLLGQMEQDLIAAGHSTSLIKQAETEYKARKKNQRAALMQKVTESM
ncbi:hypothetical protein [Ammoniphilus sp. CFH 90114]|uniref:hypothetical protein n=1 Tax=Ammoniphilus sp. CFH 90114 TaxID=2493665 RepID=UPI001025BDE5|nr:hypothetical protein [Ammoniphilus sp. CFH 90114]RXT04290.1 hypothetical protein EIZ39_20635 [Ammoniphilus sp. CFH 90114]